ncbi:MAG: SDR family oxidoreductase [Balneolaceae bacterium]
MSLQKQIVWITGASSGIGEALAYAYSDKGVKLILSARRINELERVRENCSGNIEDIKILPLDLMDTGSMEENAELAMNMFGRIDVLINNGGISQRANAAESTMETIRDIMEVNFFGTVALTKAILPYMIEKKSGHIVVISSVMGKIGTRYRSAYAASKHALHGWFDCLRQEVHEYNINVTMVCPGYVKTNVSKNALTATGKKLNEMGDAHKKAMTPKEFADRLLPKLARKKDEVYIGGIEISAVYLKRFLPGLLNKILLRTKVT